MNYGQAKLDSHERVHILMEAQEKIFEAIDLIKEVFPDDRQVKSYVLDHLQIIASSDHGFLDNSLNIDKLIARVEGKGEW
jgi:hypothetical protein